jgi:hypothetical protein
LLVSSQQVLDINALEDLSPPCCVGGPWAVLNLLDVVDIPAYQDQREECGPARHDYGDVLKLKVPNIVVTRKGMFCVRAERKLTYGALILC